MSVLVVSVFDDRYKGEEVRLSLLKKGIERVVDLEDAVVLVRTLSGKVKLHHVTHLTLGGAVTGGFLGSLLGVLMLNPVFAVFGLAAGTMVGAVSGSLSHAGVDEDFMQELAKHLKPGTSALCVLVRDNLDKVLQELKEFGGKVFQTSLRHEDITKLQEALDAVAGA
ncbi:MAG TPA: DUF1269 domain-containing protein [Syntrophobacter fumaroxidans]|nr:DUF1269 domain-containing protein [Syntrophobacter fumaroxidans]